MFAQPAQSDGFTRLGSAARSVERPAVGDALELVLSTLFEGGPRPSHEIAHGAGHEHRSGGSERADARGHVNRDSRDSGLTPRHLSRMQPAANVEAALVDGIPQVDGATNRSSRPVEGCEHAI